MLLRQARRATGLSSRSQRSSVRARQKRHRGRDFASFVTATFPTLTSALDVAGGAGTLSYSLSHDHHIPCCVVDPRPLRLSANKTKILLRPREEEEQEEEDVDEEEDDLPMPSEQGKHGRDGYRSRSQLFSTSGERIAENDRLRTRYWRANRGK